MFNSPETIASTDRRTIGQTTQFQYTPHNNNDTLWQTDKGIKLSKL
jgi:hypothetical protein